MFPNHPTHNDHTANSVLTEIFKIFATLLMIAFKYPVTAGLLLIGGLFNLVLITNKREASPNEPAFDEVDGSCTKITAQLFDSFSPKNCAALTDEFIFNRIGFQTNATDNPPPEQQFAQRQLVWRELKKIMKEPNTHEKVMRVFASSRFKLSLTSKFANAGNYHLAESTVTFNNNTGPSNTITIRTENLGCFSTTRILSHELHHKDIVTIKSSGDPIGKSLEVHKQNISSYSLGEPFETTKEFDRLDYLLTECTHFITQEFAGLRIKALEGNLTATQQARYNNLVKVVEEEYQPQCYHMPPDMMPISDETIAAVNKSPVCKTSLQAVDLQDLQLPRFYPYTICASNVVHQEEGTHFQGHSVPNFNTKQGKVEAFIKDNIYFSMFQGPTAYGYPGNKNWKKTMVLEKDAQRHEDGPAIMKAFCPDVLQYHKRFRKKHEARFDKYTHQRINNTIPRPKR